MGIPTSGAVALPPIHVMKVRVIVTLILIVSEALSVERTIVVGGAVPHTMQIVAQSLTSVLVAGPCLLETKHVSNVILLLLLGMMHTVPVRMP